MTTINFASHWLDSADLQDGKPAFYQFGHYNLEVLPVAILWFTNCLSGIYGTLGLNTNGMGIVTNYNGR